MADSKPGTLHSALRSVPLFQAPLADEASSLRRMEAIHTLLLAPAHARHGLAPAVTPVSNADGLLVREGGEGSMAMMVQTMTGVQPVDWVHHNFGASASGLAYSKTSVFLTDRTLAPHLELEVTDMTQLGLPGICFWLSLDPRLPLELHPEWVDRYMASTPAGAERSWVALERHCSQLPGWTRYVSRNPHVRAFSSQSICFMAPHTPEGWADMTAVVKEAAALWQAWIDQDQAQGRAEAEDGEQETLSAYSWAWRRFPRREAGAGKLIADFGEETMNSVWDSTAGDQRMRQPLPALSAAH